MEASAQVRFIQNGGREFLTDEPISLHTYEEEKIDIHHIFPQKWCKDNEIERKRMDCIVNKAAISSRTNRIIFRLPDEFPGVIGTLQMAPIVASHSAVEIGGNSSHMGQPSCTTSMR